MKLPFRSACETSTSPLGTHLQETGTQPICICEHLDQGAVYEETKYSHRRLRGDLLYLEVTTLEGHTLHITASVEGFFVNQSTNEKFNPARADADYKAHTLLALIKKASPKFLQNVSQNLNRRATSHPYESIPVSRPVVCWNAEPREHTYDWNRSEEAILNTYGMDSRGALRDWNEEYQHSRELPRDTVRDRIARDRAIFRVYSDFTDAAQKGAVAIIHGDVPPINPMDPKRSHVFIYNNIFFSFAIDGRNVYRDCGGDLVSHSIANHDLQGLQCFTELDQPDIYTLATVVVDYRAHRVICQSIIPGIFHGDRASRHVYGSMDQGEMIESDPDFHTLIQKSSRELHIKEHKVIDKSGKAITLALCTDSKGILGADGRNYFLDLIRLTPRDANFPDPKTHCTALLRPELIKLWCREKAFTAILNRKKQEKEKPSDDVGDETGVATAVAAAKEEGDGDTFNDQGVFSGSYMEYLNKISFNPDCFTNVELGGTPEENAADEADVIEVSKFLRENVIPKFVQNLSSLADSPLDGQSLTDLLHEKGINVRYLGVIAHLSEEERLPHITSLCQEEMVTRAAKHILAKQILKVRPEKNQKEEHWFLAPCIARFFSSFLGPNAGGVCLDDDQMKCATRVLEFLDEAERERVEREREWEDKVHTLTLERESNKERTSLPADDEASAAAPIIVADESKKKKKKKIEQIKLSNGNRAPLDPLAPANLWQRIRKIVKSKYQYDLPNQMQFRVRQKLSITRSLCLKAGIQIQCRDWDFESEEPFTQDDVLDLFPLVKVHLPQSSDASDLVDAGKACMSQGRLQTAYQYFSEALSILCQVYGPMHQDCADCYRRLAMVCYQGGNYVQAVDHQQRAVIVTEKVLGLDHPETAHANSELALFMHSIGQSEVALKHINRAIFIYELICGVNHPDAAAAHNNIALIYQDCGRIPLALKHLQEGNYCETITLSLTQKLRGYQI